MQDRGKGLLARATEAEARRRLVVTAIALERFRLRHGAYPRLLTELAPELLKAFPADFMDGQPLRYRQTRDGHFVLYSIGLACVDHGGTLPPHKERSAIYPGIPGIAIQDEGDIVWPRAASDVEAEVKRTAERKAEEDKRAEREARETERERGAEAARQERVRELLSAKPIRNETEPTIDGKPLTTILGNHKSNSHLSLDEMLTLKRVITTNDPDVATFELPISYDVVTNDQMPHLLLCLMVDGNATGSFEEAVDTERATNGDCLLTLNTTYHPPGQHALQAQLRCEMPSLELRGPVEPFFSSNLFQFEPFYNSFTPDGATLYAKLSESNGIYTFELTSPSGAHLKTFHGTTSNGVVSVHWNLIDDQGRRFTNDSFNSSFSVTLPDSGRSQTEKGP
jgi:hypothetical protein